MSRTRHATWKLTRPFRSRLDLSGQERPPAPFIVGVTRSGTTLLRLIMDSHPELAIPPETHFLPKLIKRTERGRSPVALHRFLLNERRWNDFDLDEWELLKRFGRLEPFDSTAVVRCFYDLYAEGQGKPRWGDKTPGYQVKMKRIAGALPEARFIHVIRDGRDVVLSQWQKAERPTPIVYATKRWKQRIKRSRNLGSKLGSAYREVRYEDLVARPEETIRDLCEYVELDFDPVLLRHHEGATERLEEIAKSLPETETGRKLSAEKRMSAHEMATKPLSTERLEVWRRNMEPADLEVFEDIAGDVLRDLGYPLSTD